MKWTLTNNETGESYDADMVMINMGGELICNDLECDPINMLVGAMLCYANKCEKVNEIFTNAIEARCCAS